MVDMKNILSSYFEHEELKVVKVFGSGFLVGSVRVGAMVIVRVVWVDLRVRYLARRVVLVCGEVV